MSSALFILLLSAHAGAFASIPVGTRMDYRITLASGSAEKCEFQTQTAHKEIVGYDEASRTFTVRLKYVNDKSGAVTLDTTVRLSDEGRKKWGLYSAEEIQLMVDHCEELGGSRPTGPSIYACDLKQRTPERDVHWLLMPGVPFGTIARSVVSRDSTRDCYSLLIVNHP